MKLDQWNHWWNSDGRSFALLVPNTSALITATRTSANSYRATQIMGPWWNLSLHRSVLTAAEAWRTDESRVVATTMFSSGRRFPLTNSHHSTAGGTDHWPLTSSYGCASFLKVLPTARPTDAERRAGVTTDLRLCNDAVRWAWWDGYSASGIANWISGLFSLATQYAPFSLLAPTIFSLSMHTAAVDWILQCSQQPRITVVSRSLWTWHLQFCADLSQIFMLSTR